MTVTSVILHWKTAAKLKKAQHLRIIRSVLHYTFQVDILHYSSLHFSSRYSLASFVLHETFLILITIR